MDMSAVDKTRMKQRTAPTSQCRQAIIALFLCLSGPASSALATDLVAPAGLQPAQPVPQDRWTVSATPYLWAAGVSGRTAQFGLPPVNLDLNFRNVVDHLDFAAKIMAEARHDRFSLFGDLVYLDLSKSRATPFGVLANSASLSFNAMTGTVGAGYSVLKLENGQIDIAVAARIWNLQTTLSFAGGVLNGLSKSDSANWVDGLVGVRGTYAITPNLYLTGWGLVGAGGAKLDWDLAAALGYRFNERVSVLVGYRAVGIDYDRDGFVFNVTQRGPTVGLTVGF